MRTFDTGATRDTDKTFDPEGFMHPLVVERFCRYMEVHRKQSDGNVRASDNWTKGIPLDVYMKSAWRHFLAWWKGHRLHENREDLENALCAMLFNVSGYLYEILKLKRETDRRN